MVNDADRSLKTRGERGDHEACVVMGERCYLAVSRYVVQRVHTVINYLLNDPGHGFTNMAKGTMNTQSSSARE